MGGIGNHVATKTVDDNFEVIQQNLKDRLDIILTENKIRGSTEEHHLHRTCAGVTPPTQQTLSAPHL